MKIILKLTFLYLPYIVIICTETESDAVELTDTLINDEDLSWPEIELI